MKKHQFIIFLVIGIFLSSCGDEAVQLHDNWIYKKDNQKLSISMGRNTQDQLYAVIWHAQYSETGKYLQSTEFQRFWKYEEDILTFYDIVDDVEIDKLKFKVLEIKKGSFQATVVEVDETLESMNIVDKTIVFNKVHAESQKTDAKIRFGH